MCFFRAPVVLVICGALFIFAGCQSQKNTSPVAPANSEEKVDYSNPKNWSIKCDDIKHDVDVFFVHPTTYGPPANGKYIADLDDEKLNAKTDSETVNLITEAFAKSCNIFAPRYRQVNIEVMQMPEEQKALYMDTPSGDVENALRYYLENLNGGRPIILASHSQGSNMLQLVLLKNPGLIDMDKLVAAYMPGWTFTDTDLKKMGIPLGESAGQTGCLMTWNTVGPGGKSPTAGPGARCVNPLSWTTDTKDYPASMNKGARIVFADGTVGLIPNFTSARVTEAGTLEIPTPKPAIAKKLNMSLGKEGYHSYDYDFFFNNIAANVAQRCDAYLQKHKSNSK